MDYKKRSIAYMVACTFALIAMFSVALAVQQAKPVINQQWRVTANVEVESLEEKLVELNKLGYTVNKDDIRVVGSRVVILLNEDNGPTSNNSHANK